MTYAANRHRQLDRMLDEALARDDAGGDARMAHALVSSRLRGADARTLVRGRWRRIVKGGRILWLCPHGRSDSIMCPDCRC